MKKLLFLILLLNIANPLAQEEAETEVENVAETTDAGKSPEEGKTPPEFETPESIETTEKISEDVATPFPVDI